MNVDLSLVRQGTRRLYYLTAAAWLHFLVAPLVLGLLLR